MADIVKMFTSGFWRYVVSWVLPCAAFLGGLLLTVYPSIKNLPVLKSIDTVASADTTLGLFIFGGVTLGISAVLALSYEPIYRLWEGYTWPKPLFMFGRGREIERYRSLKTKRNTNLKLAKKASEEHNDDLTAYHSTKRALLGERSQQFPEYEEDFLPTRLGNGLRAAERYGYERYGLDSQTLWYELGAATPEDLAEELNAARGVVDFFISAATLSSLYVLIAIGAALAKLDWVFACYALIAVIISRLSYLHAARSTDAIAGAQRAIVNVSRNKLASLFNLAVPDDIDREQAMWRALKAFVVNGKSDALRRWRKPASQDQKEEQENDGAVGDGRPAASLPAGKGS
ncbi:MAG TPA: hypothetical protein VLW83_12175 [Candidatus Acidoferrales bacterium]|nr:hypothetical protein [Candidatus Acidoferrales bacterium]